MSVLLVQAKLGLNCGAMNAITMEALSGSLGKLHVLFTAVLVNGESDLQVHAGNDLGIRQLPDMNVMAADNTRKTFNVLADLPDADILGSGLKEDSCGGASQGDRGLENNGGDEQRDGGIAIKLARPVGKPDDEGGYNNTNVAQRIAQNVKHHGVHAHISMVVTAGLGSSLSRHGVVMAIVDA